jgi:F-type H+-transporting ATPase subunit delta
MKGNRAAHQTHNATLQLAISQKREEAVANDMVLLSQTLVNCQELEQFLSTPVLPSSLKHDTLGKVFPKVSAEIKNLFNLLMTNNRLPILGAVAENYLNQFEALQGRVKASVITALPLTNALEAKVMEKAKMLTSDSVTLVNTVDPSIIGGFVLKVRDLQYDASVASELKALKRELTTNNTI